jgi:hypothetical protein
MEVAGQAAAALRELLPPPDEPIRFLEVGCAPGIGAVWDPLRGIIDYVGCDPLVVDRDVRSPDAGGFSRVRRLGVAVAANEGTATLHVAADPDRSSLLRPNWPVVGRYEGAWRFACREEREVRCTTLTALARRYGQPDVVRLHGQGLEYQLVSSGLDVIGAALCLEIEAGLLESYAGEYPSALIDPMLRQAGLALVDLVGRPGLRRGWSGPDSRHQPLRCQATWLRDVVGCRERPPQAQARKLLLICRALGQLAFGRELAGHLAETGVIGPALGELLSDPAAWRRPWRLGDVELRTGGSPAAGLE